MSTITLNNFTGINPRTSDTGLPVNAATEARNVKLQSGEVRSWKKPRLEYSVIQSLVKTIFKLERPTGTITSIWCEWTSDTDVCYSPQADNGEARIYYSENGVCKKTNFELALTGTGAYPRSWLDLGVKYPYDYENDQEIYPTLQAVNDGSASEDADNKEERAYVFTYVSEFGSVEEESAPSGAATVEAYLTGGHVNVSSFGTIPTDHQNITKIRIYRSVTGTSTAVYMLVDELPLVNHVFPASGTSKNGVAWTNSTYPDSRTVEQLGMELPSLYFTPPPSGLKGLVSMPNGFLAGFINNQVWFSEPYLPHAWPSAYMLTVDSPIVGLGVYGQTLVVATTRQPYTITGTHPGAMTQEKQPMTQPCVSKRSIAYDQYGVIYASAYGLVALAAGQMDVFTRSVLTQDDWSEYTPSAIVSAMYNNLYLAAYRNTDTQSVLVFSRGDEPALVNYDIDVAAFHVERGTGRVFYLDYKDNKIYELDYEANNRETYKWKSKRFAFQYQTGFTALKVDADFDSVDDYAAYVREYADIVEYNEEVFEDETGDSGAINASLLNEYDIGGSALKHLPTAPDVRSVTVALIADGETVFSRRMTSAHATRVPPVKAFAWQILLTGNVHVRSVSLSTSMKELAPNA